MTDATEIAAIKLIATKTLAELKPTLDGLLLEISTQQRRAFDSSDFIIQEFRALVRSLDALTAQLARLP